MTAPDSVPLHALAEDNLAAASPDLLRALDSVGVGLSARRACLGIVGSHRYRFGDSRTEACPANRSVGRWSSVDQGIRDGIRARLRLSKIHRMPWIRRRAREAQPPEERLPDLEFLALVKASLEEYAPGVTRGTELKGNSLSSPHGWAVGVAPPHHGGGRHYDLVAVPDVSVQPDVPCFMDCVVAMSGDPRKAADAWVQTAGACMLELLDRRGRFADHAGPDHQRGVPGWHSIISGAVGFGLDAAENQRLQSALLDANVLHRIAGTFTADLESPFFNGVKVFYGGRPGAMEVEIRVNGERHETASAAMAMLDLPEPRVFTAVRHYALLLPAPADGGEPSYSPRPASTP